MEGSCLPFVSKKPSYRWNPSIHGALSRKNRLVPGCWGFAMRFTGNFYSESAHTRGVSSNHPILVPLLACVVGAAASGAVILSLAGSSTTQPGVLSISPRAIVRNIGESETNKTVQDRPTAETSVRPTGTNEVTTQTDAEHQPEANKQESRKHRRVVTRSRESYWRGRFGRSFSQLPHFSNW